MPTRKLKQLRFKSIQEEQIIEAISLDPFAVHFDEPHLELCSELKRGFTECAQQVIYQNVYELVIDSGLSGIESIKDLIEEKGGHYRNFEEHNSPLTLEELNLNRKRYHIKLCQDDCKRDVSSRNQKKLQVTDNELGGTVYITTCHLYATKDAIQLIKELQDQPRE